MGRRQGGRKEWKKIVSHLFLSSSFLYLSNYNIHIFLLKQKSTARKVKVQGKENVYGEVEVNEKTIERGSKVRPV